MIRMCERGGACLISARNAAICRSSGENAAAMNSASADSMSNCWLWSCMSDLRLRRKRNRTGTSLKDTKLQNVDLVFQASIEFQHVGDLADGMKDGGVVPASHKSTDLRQGARCQCLCEIAGYLPGAGYRI